MRTALEIDSFDYLRLIVAIDEASGIDTPEEDYAKIQTLNTLADCLAPEGGLKVAAKKLALHPIYQLRS